MDWLIQHGPKVIEAVAILMATVFTVVSGLAAAIWALLKFLDDRRKEREAKTAAEQQRIEQQQIAEQGKRAERVATLMSEFGKTSDPEVKGWTTLALSMYPNETTRLLTMSLSQFSDETAAAVSLALVGIGAPALPELIKLNRITQLSIDSEDTEQKNIDGNKSEKARLLKRTQSVIVKLLFYLDKDSIADEDFSELDLSGCNLNGLKFDRLSLHKCKLDDANFKKAIIRNSVFRGASIDKTNFLKASLNEVDFTGASGSILAIKAYADDACFDQAHLQNSKLDASSLKGISLKNTNLDGSSICGAQLHNSTINKAHLNRVDFTKVKAKNIQCKGSKLVSAKLSEANISESTFERSEMMGISAQKLTAKCTKFLNCNLGGTDFSQSNLAGAEFRGCILGGVDFRGCSLDNIVFHKCQMETAKFDEGVDIKK